MMLRLEGIQAVFNRLHLVGGQRCAAVGHGDGLQVEQARHVGKLFFHDYEFCAGVVITRSEFILWSEHVLDSLQGVKDSVKAESRAVGLYFQPGERQSGGVEFAGESVGHLGSFVIVFDFIDEAPVESLLCGEPLTLFEQVEQFFLRMILAARGVHGGEHAVNLLIVLFVFLQSVDERL